MYRIAMLIGGQVPKDYVPSDPNVMVHDLLRMSEAIPLALKLIEAKEVDAIISPSGTASALEQHVNIPVIRSDPSQFDILRTLRQAEQVMERSTGKIALLLHKTRVISPKSLELFLATEVHHYTYESEQDIRDIVLNLSKDAYFSVVGGPTAYSFAREVGIEPFILQMSAESLDHSIVQAKGILQFTQRSKEQNTQLETALNLFVDGLLITDTTGRIIKINRRACDILGMSREELLALSVDHLFDDATCSEVYKYGMQQLDKIIEFSGGINLFSNRVPVITDGKVQGALITFQETAKIEKLEHKFRQYQSKGLTARYHFTDIISGNAAMKTTIEKAKAFSMVDSTVLIRGETGSGKEMFSQSIHNQSPRRKGPFVAINCAALPENLLESELMGYEEGAFTSAKRGGKAGLFELAHKGTIFLDEINQIPIQLQGSILRVLQEQQVLRIGGDRMIPTDMRVIAATNANLIDLIQEGKFREDLYYRLNVLNLLIPPLRERRDDIPQLVRYYSDIFARQYGPVAPFTPEAVALLESHPWPGNIRELINCIERYTIITRHLMGSDIAFVTEFLQSECRQPPASSFSGDPNTIQVLWGTLSDMERQLIHATLKRYGGNKQRTALALGVSRTTLWKKLQETSVPEASSRA